MNTLEEDIDIITTDEESIDRVTPTNWSSDKSKTMKSNIKVIGVGGGGCNAVNYMYEQKIQGCTFIVCNTDAQALESSNVPIKIQMGKGLGAGCDPTKGRNAAIESEKAIAEKVLDTGTEMLFITACMGGGTGTGAAPVIASMSKQRGILTVGVVTLPFKNEGNESMSKAIDGIHEMEKNVDSLLIINNEKLYEYYGELLIQDAFPKADEVLANAARGIVEIINKPGYINVDIEDVKTMMKNSGMALMGCGSGTGENRLNDAVQHAVVSPLLNDFDLKTSKNVLVNITAGKNENGLLMNELDKINSLINNYTGNANNFKRGILWNDDPDVGDRIDITVIATGFKMSMLQDITDLSLGNTIIIDQDFEYKPSAEKCEVELPEAQNIIKIGYNSSTGTRKFSFEENERPVLAVKPGQNLSELESVPAIRRHSSHSHK